MLNRITEGEELSAQPTEQRRRDFLRNGAAFFAGALTTTLGCREPVQQQQVAPQAPLPPKPAPAEDRLGPTAIEGRLTSIESSFHTVLDEKKETPEQKLHRLKVCLSTVEVQLKQIDSLPDSSEKTKLEGKAMQLRDNISFGIDEMEKKMERPRSETPPQIVT